MKKIVVIYIYLVLINYPVFSQGRIWFSELGVDIKQEQKISFTGGSVNKSPALGYFFNINNGGRKFAIGLQGNYSKVDLKNTTAPDVEKNSLKLWEFYFVLRYYPMLPTLRFGTKGAIRFTTGVMLGGYDFYWKQDDGYGATLKWSPLQVSSVVFAGLCFSPFLNTTGLSVKLNYMPQTLSMQNFALKEFTLKQPFSLSASLFIGPKIKS